jgi:uncharacterized membrane protein
VETDTEPGPILFEAVTTPPPGLSPLALRVLCIGLLGLSALIGLAFASVGAWPVLGFTGLEAALVLGLLALHRRSSRRSMEILRVTGGMLTVCRTDWRGRREEVSLDPYWARVSLEERPGRVSALVLRQRGSAIEIGVLLGEEQKRDLAAALEAALRRYREPVFDNPQLRTP